LGIWEYCKENLDRYLNKFNNKSNQNFTKDLLSNNFPDHMCIKNDSIVIGGDYNSNFFSNIMFEIKTCENSTDSNITCKSKE